ncbi:hypothetical protein PVAP13_6KG110175, partial [Panicum virgatum]
RSTSCAKIAFASTGAQTLPNCTRGTSTTWLASGSAAGAPEEDAAASPSRCSDDEIQLPFPIISSSTSSILVFISSPESVQVTPPPDLKTRRDENKEDDHILLEPANASFTTRAFCLKIM